MSSKKDRIIESAVKQIIKEVNAGKTYMDFSTGEELRKTGECVGCGLNVCRSRLSTVQASCGGLIMVGIKGAVGRGPKVLDCVLAQNFKWQDLSNHNHDHYRG